MMEGTKDTVFHRSNILRLQGEIREMEYPLVMGILNITPDSFYGGSRVKSEEEALSKASGMLEEGATILDIGAYSSRPGAEDIPEKEELERAVPVIKALKKEYPEAVVSVDTFRSKVAEKTLGEGADMINDISGGTLDGRMFNVVGEAQVPYVLMHMQGTPQTMQQDPTYNNVVSDVMKFLSERINEAKKAGIHDLIVDPGFGFGKTLENNFELLRSLDEFHLLECPLMVGVSRKSMIKKVLGTSPAESLNGSTVLHTLALTKGVDIIRTHDVKEAVEAVKIFNFERNAGHNGNSS